MRPCGSQPGLEHLTHPGLQNGSQWFRWDETEATKSPLLFKDSELLNRGKKEDLGKVTSTWPSRRPSNGKGANSNLSV